MIKDLTKEKPFKVLIMFTLPMLLGNIFQQLYNIADSVIVGRVVGKDGLAAVGASFGISFLAIGLATGASQGCSIIISQCFGAKDYKKVKSAISTALISVVSFGFVLWIISFFALKPLLHFLNTPAGVFESSYSFAKIIFFGCVFIFLYNCLTAIFNSLGDSVTPLIFLIGSTCLNIFLDILFVIILGKGVDGAAIATLISQICSALGLLIYFIIRFKKLNLTSEKTPVYDFSILKNMIKIAIPSMLQQSMVSIGMMAIQGLVNSFGTDMMAGYTAATKVDSLAVMPMLNIGIALSSYTAQNLGAKLFDRIKQGYYSALKIGGIITAVISTSIIIFGKYFILAFIDSESGAEALVRGTGYLNVVSIFYFLFAIMCITNGLLRGSGNMKAFMTSTLLNICLRIAFAYLLTPVMGYHSIFWSIPLGWLVASAVSLFSYKKGVWKKKQEQ